MRTFCIVPWTQVCIHESDIKLCCIGESVGSLTSSTIPEILNSHEVKALRLDMLAGAKNDYCKPCYLNEDLGIKSLRQDSNNGKDHGVSTEPDGASLKLSLSSVEIRFSNLCNFKCRMCMGGNSSSIAAEDHARGLKKHPILVTLNKTDIILQLREYYGTLTRFYFMGGEPLMSPDHWTLMDELIQADKAKNITLFYTTNGSTLTFKDRHIFDYWSKFKDVFVTFSIDAFEQGAEYWRDGTVWTELMDNIAQTQKLKNVHVQIHSLITWPTVFSWMKFMEYCINSGVIAEDKIDVYFLYHPSAFSLASAPAFKKELVRVALEKLKKRTTSYKTLHHIEMINKFMLKDTQQHLNQLHNTIDLDKHRKKDFFAAFPEHEDMRGYFE